MNANTNSRFSILLVSHPENASLTALLRRETDHLEHITTFEDGLNATLKHQYDFVFAAEELEAHSGLEFLRQSQAHGCKTPLIFVMQRENAELEDEALRAGAIDVLNEAEISPALLKRVLRFASEQKSRAAQLETATGLLQTTLETAMDGILVVDERGHILFFNRKFVEMWRVPISVMEAGDNEALRHFVLAQLQNPDEFMARVRQLHEQPEVSSLDVLLFKDGRVFEHFSRSQFRDGQCLGRVSSFRDISEHERATQALLHSEAHNATILQSALDCIISMDGQGRVVEWNPAAEETFGFTRAQAVGQLMADLIVPPDLRDAHLAGLKRYLETGQARLLGQRAEIRACRADGSELIVELSIVRIPVEGEPLFTGYLRDITQRKRAEVEFQESQKRYERMVANVPGMVFQFVVRPDGSRSFPYVSDGCRELFGVEPEQVVEDGSLLFKAGHADDVESLEESIRESAQTMTPWRWEGRFLDARTGQTKRFQGASRPEPQADGAIVWDGLLMDITERKTAEEDVRERAKYEALTAALSTFFIDLPSVEVDEGINNALRALGEFAQVERAYVFLWDVEKREMSNTHEWCAPGIEAQMERLQNAPAAALPWISPRLLSLETIHIPRVADLPPEAQAERAEFAFQGIESIVLVPMVYRGRLMGHSRDFTFAGDQPERATRRARAGAHARSSSRTFPDSAICERSSRSQNRDFGAFGFGR